ncbi:MAG: acyl-ACP--UDP-N-acetylglucosamine O-acyltransferase [Armatimonadetes bacterium]|nr:acyl-ACP--UDP-N-acetylglucosamine O-acyltransferase [Armatimonadota bacterium]
MRKGGGVRIHPTAIVDPTADLAAGVEIGPYCVIGPNVRIGEGTRLASHAVIEPYTTIGRHSQISHGAVLGGVPQDTKFRGERSHLIIGDRNIIREFVTIHRATGEDTATRIGDDNMIMAYCHIGHNCLLGSRILMANQMGMSGHCEVEDQVVFGGQVGIHQFVRIGKLAMIGGVSKVVQDVPPFMVVDGRPAGVININVIGLRRAGIPPRVRSELRQAFRLLYRSNLNLAQGIEAVCNEVEWSAERDYLLEFLSKLRRGFAGRQRDPNRPRGRERDLYLDGRPSPNGEL